MAGAADEACVMVAVAVTVTVCAPAAPTDPAAAVVKEAVEVAATALGLGFGSKSSGFCAAAHATRASTAARRMTGTMLVVVSYDKRTHRLRCLRFEPQPHNLIILTCIVGDGLAAQLFGVEVPCWNGRVCRLKNLPCAAQEEGAWRGWMFEHCDGQGQGCQVRRSPLSLPNQESDEVEGFECSEDLGSSYVRLWFSKSLFPSVVT